MRLDKFLKVARIIKRRPVAKQIAEQNRIKVNGNAAKPSVVVAPGDEVEITFGHSRLTLQVLQVKEHVKKDEAATLYEVIKEEKINQAE
jgi:ribosomal 50S subunit-recycling heat shock protein